MALKYKIFSIGISFVYAFLKNMLNLNLFNNGTSKNKLSDFQQLI